MNPPEPVCQCHTNIESIDRAGSRLPSDGIHGYKVLNDNGCHFCRIVNGIHILYPDIGRIFLSTQRVDILLVNLRGSET